jgi:phosphatidylglycerol lysyltransferase
MRKMLRRVEEEQCAFELIPQERVAAILPELRAISDAWLAEKKTREKGFSLGFFAEEYVSRFPVAVVKRGERIVAFANVWTSSNNEELSVDLMRHAADSPDGAMDYMFVQLMQWGAAQGFHWFNLGMAPLSGLERHPLAPFWHKLGLLVHRYGEPFYNFGGLRKYKEKFDPVWESRDLAYPGGLTLPRTLADVAALIAGGYTRILRK